MAQFRDFVWIVISFDPYIIFLLEKTNKRIYENLRSDNGMRMRTFMREQFRLVRTDASSYDYAYCKMLLKDCLQKPSYLSNKYQKGNILYRYDVFSGAVKQFDLSIVSKDFDFEYSSCIFLNDQEIFISGGVRWLDRFE